MLPGEIDLPRVPAQHQRRVRITMFVVVVMLTHEGRIHAEAVQVIEPAHMQRIGEVNPRYQSYNVEMLQVTGGRFWKPYANDKRPSVDRAEVTTGEGQTPAGMDPGAYSYRPPIDLKNERRRKLAAALGPAYVRVSGTWANTTYFTGPDEALKAPPDGFSGILTRDQWKGVIDFAHAVNAEIVTSVAISPGTRDSSGSWTPTQSKRLFDFTAAEEGHIAAAEFMNEPNAALMGGAPRGYDAAAYGHDFASFCAFAKQADPDMVVLGPGSVGETDGDWGVMYGSDGVLKTADLLAALPRRVDAFSYHHYGAASQRCARMGMQTTAEAALSDDWLSRTDQTLSFYQRLRDKFEPGKPMWLTETADAACGGNPWAATFLDSFRYLDQLGRLAKQGVQVVMHNTLEASDYGLLDEDSLMPRPNYWAALLWHKLMGTTVLDSGIPIQPGLHVYAHSLPDVPGGVAVLVINTDKSAKRTLTIPLAAKRYSLSADSLNDAHVKLNGKTLELGDSDSLPQLTGVDLAKGQTDFGPGSITFLAFPAAGNSTEQKR